MPTVVVSDVSRWYGEVIGLSGATFQLDPGVTGLLGVNGAGKSTLVKILTAQIQPSLGEVRILGQQVWGNPQLFQHVGYCPEADAIYAEWSAPEFLIGLLRLSGQRGQPARRRVRDVLEQVGLDPELRKAMGAFSKGMRQRAKLAQALLLEPEVLVLDEPLNGMDPVGRQETMALVSRLGASGHTVLVSSHILHEVEHMTQNVVLLHHGRVMAHGNVHEIRDLIEDRARTVRVRCSDPHRLASHLFEIRDITGVRFGDEPNVLILETARADAFFARLTQIGTEDGIVIDEVRPLDDDLESVFHYLVR